jgi:WD40 repeat protein
MSYRKQLVPFVVAIGFAMTAQNSPAQNEKRFDRFDGAVVSLAFADDDLFAAAANGNPGADRSGQIRLQSSTREQPPEFLQYESSEPLSHRFTHLAFSRDGVYLAALSANVRSLTGTVPGGARVWDFKSRKLVGVIPRARAFVVFTPDAKRFVTCQSDNSFVMFSAPSFNEPKSIEIEIPSGDAISCAAFGKNVNLIAFGTRNGSVSLYDFESRKLVPLLKAPSIAKTFLAFSFTGNFIATLGADGSVSVWDAAEHSLLKFAGSHDSSVTALEFAPSGKLLAMAYRDGSTRLWELPDGGRGSITRGETISFHRAPVKAIAFSPGGTALATGGLDEMVVVTPIKY